MTLNTEFMQLNDMVSQVIRIVRGRAEDNRLKLIYADREMREIEADPRAVKQVLLNLMTNAIKFTPEGGAVTCEVIEKTAGLIVKISDTGIGIAQEDIDRLAKPFEQIDSQHSRQHEGTGLGLALSKSLIELHGGNFIIESVLGQGTTVTFTLPNKPPAQKAAEDTTEVGHEISRLAQDIADVLTDNETNKPLMPAAAAITAPMPPAPASQPVTSQPVTPQPVPISQPVTPPPAPYQTVQSAPPPHMPAMPPYPAQTQQGQAQQGQAQTAQPSPVPPPPKPQSAA